MPLVAPVAIARRPLIGRLAMANLSPSFSTALRDRCSAGAGDCGLQLLSYPSIQAFT
jgi:hypothetical protein